MKTSIIITSYNYENFIAIAIESIISQTISDWELIIVDDGSKDKSVEIIKKYCQKDDRIKLYTHPNNTNKGLKESLLLGIKKSQYDWIAFLESDDYLEPNYLEEKIKFIKKYPDCNFVYNNVECFGNQEKIKNLEKYFLNLEKIWHDSIFKYVFDDFGEKNIVPTFSCVMCKKELLLNSNFNTPCEPIIDYWLWWQIAENNKIGFINKKLTNWKIHQNSYLKTSSKTLKYYITRALFIPKILKIFRKTPKLSYNNKIEKNIFLSIILYIGIYLKKIISIFIKNLFKTC